MISYRWFLQTVFSPTMTYSLWSVLFVPARARCALHATIIYLLLPVVAGVAHASLPPRAVMSKPSSPTPAAGMFLVARRGFLDPNFSETVIYLLQHDREATFGVVVNRPAGTVLSDTLPYMADTAFASSPVYRGGPMDPELLVMLVRNQPHSDLMRPITDSIQASISLQVLNEMLVENRPPEEVRFYLGYAGWTPGRLEQELEHHYWHLLKGDPDAVFKADAETLWQRLIERLDPVGSPASPTLPGERETPKLPGPP